MSTATPTRSRRRVPFPISTTLLLVTAAVSVVALLDHDVMAQLTRDETLVRAGRWWRLVTPILVQPDGWGQFVFNLAGIAVVGAALERRRPPWLWCAVYVAAGVGSIAILTVLRPGDHGGGSSDAVAGLVGALTVTEVLGRRPAAGALAAVSTAYSAFFGAYLTALDLAGVWPAMVAGDVAVAAVLTARRRVGADRTAIGLLVLIGLAGVVMAVRLDGHGIGLLTGVAVAGVGHRVAVRGRWRAVSR